MILPQDDRKATQFSEIRMAYDDKNIISLYFFNNTIKGDYIVESYKGLSLVRTIIF